MIDTSIALPTQAAKVSLFRKLLTNPTGAVSMLVLAIVALAAVLAPVLATHDPGLASLQAVLAKSGPDHVLGADSAGRDVFSRLLFAGQFSLAGALLALVVAVAIGVTGGLVAGYYGGWFDSASSWLTGLLMAMPGIVILLAARAVVGPSMWLSMMIFGVLLSPAYFRLVYACVTAVRNELYVDAARVSGLSDFRIIGRHILTVVRAPVIIQSAMVLGIAIAIQAGLEFLGLGDLNIPTWGSMLNDGFINLYKAPTLVLWPSLVLGVVCIALTLLANAMRDELERSRGPVKRRRKGTAVVDSAEAAAKRGEPAVVHPETPAGAGTASAGEVLLEVTDLGVGYDQPDGSTTHVVNHVGLTVRRGEVHGLVGESGSGKTQTAFSILRLLPQGGRVTGGSIVFDGTDLARLSEKEMTKVRGQRIAYIPQEPMSNLDAAFTIGGQLMEPMRVCLGISKAEARKRALALLAKVGIPNPERTFNAYPHQISGGMAQRVLIAGAVSCEPDLLIADEPTTALDVTVQAEVLDLLRELQDELKMGVILVTHNFGVVADLCDRVTVMQTGRVVETGPVRTIFKDARHPYTRQLLEAILEDAAPRGPLGAAGPRTNGASTDGSLTSLTGVKP
ncbi:dipeptide/oligopeptide/nickel ABC transporter permease/ATP-binding protein [Arthrobacter bambusae]|uniref:ABC-type dipeptide/oligopeptide/nickel transport system ATPase component/ABC-type dipeptide/oligopeptide/nickel transport system permease subunit n=1 Tax=Arthrobacter bambusae TaxID=1338426 RepID=A0AAW8DH74_9MICC|nr:dipeptide/oligopeptide/nickel ABC transporter permease/ATP-binding protein [Arthrobacter bambusae]MDP9904846.1 ABC-type dipeptide/oligopeptide/nickel transport system ATPase component/ABC-type dipeptide/oligopeptide/nickel transport system permease subunit [Arthrobacter bambusae]MDQ0129662.1 ABC-type dipeptide/oligopeptide/nickel transport system ATPase component/ABC-type dipeptide/oligopeptide/nickel transport system permease subunit [Arthrobacter bambusae]MDQ0180725.1 ABC-type dipeptide/oli